MGHASATVDEVLMVMLLLTLVLPPLVVALILDWVRESGLRQAPEAAPARVPSTRPRPPSPAG
jgi:hypothetical protein